MIPVARQKIKVKLPVANEIIDIHPIVALKITKILSM